ncbi:Variant surface glycoprotein [Trypanosoma congolense IL3000]|uniref:Variant surface glycoprotein n=1 Tax=Trypanosoma congolense (strain IL3000) TaxID=1068625 RepID=F9W5W3_TRYCI|nr:Variant surface glycoprotein [Trypanosoma congolense IL3000]
MMKLKCLILVVMCLVVSNADENEKKDHNGDAHDALCELLKAAVGKWGDGGKHLSGPLQKALAKTIFGKQSSVETVESLKGKLPVDYDGVVKQRESRGIACGEPRNDGGDYNNVHQTRWSGHSAPHDLVCLCTAGEKGWPVNQSETSTDKDKLCGQDRTALKAESNKGWDSKNQGEKEEGKEQINATWGEVVKPCLKSGTGTNLKDALEKFKQKLVNKSDEVYLNRYQLGQGTPDDYGACTGSEKKGVCVAYFNSTTTRYPMPWWVDLQNALPEEEKFQEEKRREEERRKQQEKERKTNEPHTEIITPTTNQTEQSNKDKLHEAIRKYNTTSSTPIIPPSSWLLSAAILI